MYDDSPRFTDCPSRADLMEFVTGNLSSSALARIAAHVERCPACEIALNAMDGQGDSFLRRIRQAAIETPLGESRVPRELLAVAQAARGESRRRAAWPDLGLRRLGKFELLEELGVGSFGHVFRARDTELGRIVAIKLLRAGRLAGREEIDRFAREARSAAQLTHPGLVGMYETGQTEEGEFYLVEEFVEGKTLAAHLKTRAFDPCEAAELIADVADAVDYAHRRGVIHRDIKPSNILLDVEGRPHVMDFGLAKRETDETPMTLEGQFLGTPAYVSPEQARGDAQQVDARTDVYSLGVTLYELLTGERPFRGNRQMLLLQVLNDEPRPPRQLNDKVPRDLETICLKALAKTPPRRYATARDLADDLRRFLKGALIQARPAGRAERLGRWCRNNPVAAGLLLAVTLGSAFGMWQLSKLSESLVQSSALESASQQSEIIDEVNSLYSREVVDRARLNGIEVTHDYDLRKGALPLPATLTILLGKHLHQKCGESGVQVRLYSDHPFRSRTDGGPQDDFERQALARLREQPNDPYYRFEEFQGRASLRYATARRMQATCIECHNTHPDSTKLDWKEGDVRGVLEIIRPLDRDEKRTREGLRGTLVLMAMVSGALLGTTVLVLLAGRRRRKG